LVSSTQGKQVESTDDTLARLLLALQPVALADVGMHSRAARVQSPHYVKSSLAAFQPHNVAARSPSALMEEEGEEEEDDYLDYIQAPVAIVADGGEGLGREVAIRLGNLSCRVVIGYADSAEAAEKVVQEIKALGGDGVAVQADALFKAAADTFKDHVSVFVNSANVNMTSGFSMAFAPDSWLDESNTKGVGAIVSGEYAGKAASAQGSMELTIDNLGLEIKKVFEDAEKEAESV
jgi:hypothetical protein